MRDRILSLLLTCISRSLLLRDRLAGRMSQFQRSFPFEKERLRIVSGGRMLSAVYVSAGMVSPAVLICHGIGERVEYWGQVQTLLKTMGISSLIFNYSGYGASSGAVTAAHCEEDASAACRALAELECGPIFLLGFSLGTAIATAIATQENIRGLVLCEGFTSLREAGQVLGVPRPITRIVPNIWHSVRRIESVQVQSWSYTATEIVSFQ